METKPSADAPTVGAIVARVWVILHTAALSDSYRTALVAALALPGNILADTPDGRWACIVWTCCVTAGGRREDAIPAAAAAELFMVALDVLDDEEDGEATPLRTALGAARALNVSTGLLLLAHRSLLTAPGGAMLLVLQRRLCKTAVFSGKSRPMSRLCWPSAPVIAAIRVSRSSTKAALRSYWKNPSL